MSDTVNEAELGQLRKSMTPAEHLLHLLNIGWNPNSPLIVKYVREEHLERTLKDWQDINSRRADNNSKVGGKNKN